MYWSSTGVGNCFTSAGATKTNLSNLLLNATANSVAKYPQNKCPHNIIGLSIFSLSKNICKILTKKPILYSSIGSSLSPNPIISGIIILKYLDNIGATFSHLSHEAPSPCSRTNIEHRLENPPIVVKVFYFMSIYAHEPLRKKVVLLVITIVIVCSRIIIVIKTHMICFSIWINLWHEHTLHLFLSRWW